MRETWQGEQDRTSPTLRALLLAGGYVLFGSLWIVASTAGVAMAVGEITRATQIELAKGLGFIFVTATALFLASRVVLVRAEGSARDLAAHREALLLAERRAQASLLCSTLAHDLNNLFTVVRAGVHGLRSTTEAKEADELLDEVDVAVDQGTLLVRRMSRMGTAAELGEAAEIELGQAVRDTVDLIRNHPAVRRVGLEFDLAESLAVTGYMVHLRQLVTNLVINAAEAAGSGGTVIVRVASDGGQAVLEVHDDGPGISPEVREHLFEVFATSKEEGTGLGLVSCKMVAEALGGSIEAEQSPRGGACFRVRIPAADE